MDRVAITGVATGPLWYSVHEEPSYLRIVPERPTAMALDGEVPPMPSRASSEPALSVRFVFFFPL